MSIKLIYLSEANLKEKTFIQELASFFNTGKKTILLHDHFGKTAEDTRFVTKRISAVLSEAMVVNIPVSGDQRSLFQQDGGFRSDIILQAFNTVQVVITNALTENGKGVVSDLLQRIRMKIPEVEIILFPASSRSPLGKTRSLITGKAEYEQLLAMYEEEKAVLDLGLHLAPASIAASHNFMK